MSRIIISKNEEEVRNKYKSGISWTPFILIFVGIILLLQQIGSFSFDNWWAGFILIPAFSSFAAAIEIWRRSGRFSFAVWSTFYGGLFPLLVALIFLFNLSWGDHWPLFIILGGFGMFISGFHRPQNVVMPGALTSHRPWPIFIGLSALLLGLVFLGFNLELLPRFSFFGNYNWWGIFILIPALGGLVSALSLIARRQSTYWVVINLGAAAIIGLAGIIAFFKLDWGMMNNAFAIVLITAGIILLLNFSSGDLQDR